MRKINGPGPEPGRDHLPGPHRPRQRPTGSGRIPRDPSVSLDRGGYGPQRRRMRRCRLHDASLDTQALATLDKNNVRQDFVTAPVGRLALLASPELGQCPVEEPARSVQHGHLGVGQVEPDGIN